MGWLIDMAAGIGGGARSHHGKISFSIIIYFLRRTYSSKERGLGVFMLREGDRKRTSFLYPLPTTSTFEFFVEGVEFFFWAV